MSEAKIATQRSGFWWLYLLPLAHFCACLWFHFAELAWWPISFVDFPVSVVLLAFALRFGRPMYFFGFWGTLWWCLLSYKAQSWIRNRRGYR
jgi:hypothetical protein